jgi:hypothetical protein
MRNVISLFLFLIGAGMMISLLAQLVERSRSRRRLNPWVDQWALRMRSLFDPILLPCGYSVGHPFENSGRCIVPYENHSRGLKVEFAWSANGSGWFHMVFSKMNASGQVNYSDGLNSMDIFDLAKLRAGYDYKQYVTLYAGPEQVLLHTERLLSEDQSFFASTRLPDEDLIMQLRSYSEEMRYDTSSLHSKDLHEFHHSLRKALAPIMSERSFELVRDTTELPPYDTDHMTPRLIYEGPGARFEVGQMDWRDFPNIQCIYMNGQEVFTVDLWKQSADQAVQALTRELEQRSSIAKAR